MKQLLADYEYQNNNFYQLLKIIEISKSVTGTKNSFFNKRVLFYAPPKQEKVLYLMNFVKN